MKAYLTLLLICLVAFGGIAQDKVDSLVRKSSIAVGINAADLFGNYGGLTLFGQVNVKGWFVIEMGGGPIFYPEEWTYHVHPDKFESSNPPFIFDFMDDDKAIETYDKWGGKVYSELKYYIVKKSYSPFVGLGASYIYSELTVKHAEFIVLDDREEFYTSYYRTVETEVESRVKSYYVQVGYRHNFFNGKLFLEGGVQVRHIDKESTPEKIVPQNTVVLTSNFYKNWGKYPRDIGFDIKCGFVF